MKEVTELNVVETTEGIGRGCTQPMYFYDDVETKSVKELSAKQILATHSQMNTIKEMRVEMENERKKVLGDDDITNKLEEMIVTISAAEIKNLSDEGITEIYTIDGNEIELELEMPEKRKVAFKRDFLIYLKESTEASKVMDKELAELESAIDGHSEELNSLISEFGNLSNFIHNQLKEDHANATGEAKARYKVMLDAYEDAFNLTNVKEHFDGQNIRNVIGDYYSRSESVYTRFLKNIKPLKFSTDLTIFNNLETLHLSEEHHKIPNIFLFAIIKMYSHRKHVTKEYDGVFLSQLAVNIKSLYADSFTSPEEKANFIDNISNVVALFTAKA